MREIDEAALRDVAKRLQRQNEVGLFGVPDDFRIVGYGESARTIDALLDELARLRSALPVDRGVALSSGEITRLAQLASMGIERAHYGTLAKKDLDRELISRARSLPDLPVQTEDGR